ncbi:MAG: dephospho-CoA kinase, partial [Candidatus Nanopelagicus sp.]
VSVSEELRRERLLKRGMSLSQINQRMAAQSTDAQREAIADTVIRNDKSQADLLSEVEKVWEILQQKNNEKE